MVAALRPRCPLAGMRSWLGGYETPLPIRCRGAFHLYAARTTTDGSPRLLVTSAPSADLRAARASLDRLAAAHSRVEHESIPAVRERGEHDGTAFVALGCAPLCDGEAAIAALADAKTRVGYREALAVVDRIGGALEAAHRVRDPYTREPVVLGGIGWANVIVCTDGSLCLLGFGHNVVGRDERGVLAGVPSFFAPPEMGAGGAATPSGDAYAFVLLQRSVISYCELPASLERVFLGKPQPGDEEVAELVRWSTEHVVSAPPSHRAGMPELRRRWEREWALFGMTPDHAAIGERLVALFTGTASSRAAPPAALVVGPDAAWFRAPHGDTQPLQGRGALKRLLAALAEERLRAPGRRLAPEALLEAGWPGERPLREAGLNRVYVAISHLRKLGLREVIQRDDRGYRLDPGVALTLERQSV